MEPTPNSGPLLAPQKDSLPPAATAASIRRGRLFYLGLAGIILGAVCCILSATFIAISYFIDHSVGGLIVRSSSEMPGTILSSNNLSALLLWLSMAAGIIGILLVAAGFTVILIERKNNARVQHLRLNDPKPREQKIIQPAYILTADPPVLEVRPDEQVEVLLTAMHTSPEGGSETASEASLQVLVPNSPGGLTAKPSSGKGSLGCIFSVPVPTVCEEVTVLAIASIDDQVKARTYVYVRIMPKYTLELHWEDPQQGALQVDGKEVLAWTKVIAIPPDPSATSEALVRKIDVTVQGPNSNWIQQPLKPFVKEDKQWNPISVVRPSPETELQPGNPRLEAHFTSAGQNLTVRLPFEIDVISTGKDNFNDDKNE